MLELFFWILVFLLFHSYVLFPVAINMLARRRQANAIVYTLDDDLPFVSIIISAYNEEKVIEHRITHILNTTYPLDKVEILVGSDGSGDRTNSILERLGVSHPGLRMFLFHQRQGKGNVLNKLIQEARGDILLLTDAKVEFSDRVIFELVKHFKNAWVGIVGGNLINKKIRQDGISMQEDQFMSREIQIKYSEGVLWGTTMGVYGACYAIRKELFPAIPERFAVEDFYVTLRVLEKEYKSIIELKAECYEDVPNFLSEEFRRKVRISSGNFQNLGTFMHLMAKPNRLSFTFISHKVIRWLGPFIITGAFILNGFLLSSNPFYLVIFFIQLLLLIIPIIDFFLHKIHLHIIPLRFVTHFYTMNLALLVGFVKYLKGVKTNVWEPTKR